MDGQARFMHARKMGRTRGWMKIIVEIGKRKRQVGK